MKRYKTRPGVVLTTISGQYVLIAAKSVQGKCPYVSQINESTAFCWRLLEQGINFDEMFAKLSEEYILEDPAIIRADLEELLEQMKSANYLVEET